LLQVKVIFHVKKTWFFTGWLKWQWWQGFARLWKNVLGGNFNKILMRF